MLKRTPAVFSSRSASDGWSPSHSASVTLIVQSSPIGARRSSTNFTADLHDSRFRTTSRTFLYSGPLSDQVFTSSAAGNAIRPTMALARSSGDWRRSRRRRSFIVDEDDTTVDPPPGRRDSEAQRDPDFQENDGGRGTSEVQVRAARGFLEPEQR